MYLFLFCFFVFFCFSALRGCLFLCLLQITRDIWMQVLVIWMATLLKLSVANVHSVVVLTYSAANINILMISTN